MLYLKMPNVYTESLHPRDALFIRLVSTMVFNAFIDAVNWLFFQLARYPVVMPGWVLCFNFYYKLVIYDVIYV